VILWNQIRKLPFKLQTVIILKYMNECNQEEIANILNIPVGTVKSRLSNGLKNLRLRLKCEDHETVKEVFSL
jgi:RNA polymerase sigma-70 factor (ECF subfamily)